MMASSTFIWSWKPTARQRNHDDPFFAEGNMACHLQYNKHVCVELEYSKDDDIVDVEKREFLCSQQNCNKMFTSISEYENHYKSVHQNSCAECRRCFPNQHLLDLHLVEQHDQIFQLSVSKKPSYRCLLENCPVMSRTPEERKEHLISVHKYPSNFRFINLSKASKRDSKTSKKPGPVSSDRDTTSGVCEMKENATAVDEEMEVLVTDQMEFSDQNIGQTLTSRKFQPRIPKTISFGHGVTRGFHRPPRRGKRNNPWQSKVETVSDTSVNIEDVRMGDLTDVLNSAN